MGNVVLLPVKPPTPTRADIQPALDRIHTEQIRLQIVRNHLHDEVVSVAGQLTRLDIEERALWDSVILPTLIHDYDWRKTETIGTCKSCGRPTQWLYRRIYTCEEQKHRKERKERIKTVTVSTSHRRAEVSDRVWAILSDEEVE